MKSQTQSSLVFRKYPWAVWIVGTIFICFGIYLVVHLSVGDRLGKFLPHHDSDNPHNVWWQYLLTGLIFVLGTLFIYSGSITTVNLDKYLNLLETR